MCHKPSIKGKGKMATLRENTLAVKGPALFNKLPPELRMLQDVKLETFKLRLDKYLQTIPDFPAVQGYKDPLGQYSNSIAVRRPSCKKGVAVYQS